MNVYSAICAALREGRRVSLATIIRSKGPVPAPLHSKMAVFPGGEPEMVGTVGGGCLDAAVIRADMVGRTAGDEEGGPGPARTAVVRHYTLDDELGETAMTCGGAVDILHELLDPVLLPAFEAVEERIRDGGDSILVTAMDGGEHFMKTVLGPSGEILTSCGTRADGFADPGAAARPSPRDPVRMATQGGRDYLMEFIEAPPPVMIFGGGHVGKAVADVAALSGFRVTVVDDRPEFASADRFPAGTRVVCDRFDRAWEAIDVSDRTFVVIVTRGHKHDETVLGRCLGRNPRYVGMIGSRRKVNLTFDSLRKGGVPEERLDIVHAPVGLKIGARTPEEIGVSIVAEMISVRRLGGSP